jgi:hypothetical protein
MYSDFVPDCPLAKERMKGWVHFRNMNHDLYQIIIEFLKFLTVVAPLAAPVLIPHFKKRRRK